MSIFLLNDCNFLRLGLAPGAHFYLRILIASMYFDIISDFVLPQIGLQFQACATHFKFKVTQMHEDTSIYA